MKHWKALSTAICLFLLLGIVITGYKLFSGSNKNEAKKYTTAQVKKGTIQTQVACTGKVVSNQDIEIKSKASGKVINLPFDISDTVRASELLVKLDPTDEQRNVEKALATLEATKAHLNSAKQGLIIDENKLKTARMNIQAEISSTKADWEDAKNKAEREKQLYEKKLSSQEELDTKKTEAIKAKSAYEKALVKHEELKTQKMELELKRQAVRLEKSNVRAATIDLEIAEQRLLDTCILAPIDGTLTVKNVQIGQIISSGINNVSGGTTMLTLSDLSRIFIIASVDESDIGKIQLGQKAEITVDSYPGDLFQGQVVQIGARGINMSNVVTFDVKIEILKKNKSLLKPEMSANIKIISKEKSNILLIPNEAIEFSPEGPKAKIVLPDKTIISRSIVLGLENEGVTEVVEGVKEGETVLLDPGVVQSKWSNVRKIANK